MRARSILAALALLISLPGPPLASASSPFVIFFDSNDAGLDETDRAILDNAAAALEQTGNSVILVGHADRAGDAAHNHTLACRRARAVRSYLLSRGFPAERTAVQSAGEDWRLVETADGVAEPQNRSVWFEMTERPLVPADGMDEGRCVPYRR